MTTALNGIDQFLLVALPVLWVVIVFEVVRAKLRRKKLMSDGQLRYEPPKSSRRLAGVVVSGERIASFVRSGKRELRITSKVPEDAEFYKAFFDESRNAFIVVMEDESFAPVPEGGVIPILQNPIVVTVEDMK